MTVNTIIVIVAIILYMAMMIGMGFRFSKGNQTSSDYYLGGRQLGPFVTAMSAEASDMSAYLLMGIPGLALMCGLAEASWTAIGLAIGTYLNWLFVSKRLRKYTEKIGAVTIPEFFSKRFDDKKNILSIIASLVIIVFFIPYTASGFSACGKFFHSLFGMDYLTAVIICAAVIIIYCTLGGFLAASTTDFVQSIIMSLALITVLGISEGIIGGFHNIIDNASQMDGYLNLFKGFSVETMTTGKYGPITIASTLAWGLGYFGMPHILLRFMAIKDPKKLKLSRRIASVWVVISMGVAVLIGVAGYSLMKTGVIGVNYETASAAESIIVDFSKFLSTRGWIPAFAAGIFLSGILASTMSTADSQLIAASSSITQDLLVNTFKVKLSEKQTLIIARVSVVIISIIAVFLARDPNGSVFYIVSFAWAGFGAAFGPVVLLSLFWRRANKWGALAGMLAGGVMIFIWKFIIRVQFAGTVLDIYELLPAFITGLIAMVVVSLLTKAPADDVTRTFDEVKQNLNA